MGDAETGVVACVCGVGVRRKFMLFDSGVLQKSSSCGQLRSLGCLGAFVSWVSRVMFWRYVSR